jgi:hypothetical protein
VFLTVNNNNNNNNNNVVAVTYHTRSLGSSGPFPRVFVTPQTETRLRKPLPKGCECPRSLVPDTTLTRHSSDTLSRLVPWCLFRRATNSLVEVSHGPICLHRPNTATVSSNFTGNAEACLRFVLTCTGRCLAGVHCSNTN